MTREEAIEVLGVIKEVTVWKDRKEALGMAIEALSEEEKLKTQLANCHKEILRLLDLNMLTEDENDVVEKNDEVIDRTSREDALQCKPEFLNPNPNDKPNNYHIGWNDAIKTWYADIKSIPSADRPSIVRCKDCEYIQDDITHNFCAEHNHKCYEDDFCSWARMKGGTE